MMFCHILYISNHINMIIKEEAHLLLIVGNKIVTKKRRNRLVVGFLCKGNKSPLTIKQNWRKEKDCSSFRQHIYFAVNRNKFSLFWIYRQRNELNLFSTTTFSIHQYPVMLCEVVPAYLRKPDKWQHPLAYCNHVPQTPQKFGSFPGKG